MVKSLQPCLEMSKSIVTLPRNKCYFYSNIVESQQSMSFWFCGHSHSFLPHEKRAKHKSEKKRWSRSTKRLRYHRCVLPHCYKRPIHIGSICLELGSQWLGQWLKCFQMVPTRSNLLQSERIRFAKDPPFFFPCCIPPPTIPLWKGQTLHFCSKKKKILCNPFHQCVNTAKVCHGVSMLQVLHAVLRAYGTIKLLKSAPSCVLYYQFVICSLNNMSNTCLPASFCFAATGTGLLSHRQTSTID